MWEGGGDRWPFCIKHTTDPTPLARGSALMGAPGTRPVCYPRGTKAQFDSDQSMVDSSRSSLLSILRAPDNQEDWGFPFRL